MKRPLAHLATSLTMFCLVCPHWVGARQPPQNRKWIAQNPKYVDFTSAGIHFSARDVKEGPDTVTAALHLPAGEPWVVTFDLQMTPKPASGMSIHLTQGATELAWLGAGDFYKYLSGFLGTGNANMPLNQPWDNAWHSFAYKSDGKILSLWHNGSECGETTLLGTPDSISIQSTGMEMRVRNVHVEKQPRLNTRNVDIPFFTENFVTPQFIERWNGSNNGGSVAIGDKGLKLEGAGKGYPVLTSQSNPFPKSGNWTASFGYHYSSIGNYGTEIRCNRSDGNATLLVHQDVHGQFLTLGNKIIWQSSPGTQWHVVSLVKRDNQFVVYIDGIQISRSAASESPASFRIGGGLLDNPWDWNNLEIAFLKVNTGEHPLNLTALNERANLVPTEHDKLFVTPSSQKVANNPFASPATLPVVTADTAVEKLNKQIDDHNLLVAKASKLDELKSKYLLDYSQCKLAKDIADSSGQEGRYYEALNGMSQFSALYDAACMQSNLVWSQALTLRSIIEASPLYTLVPQTKGTDVSVTVVVHTEN